MSMTTWYVEPWKSPFTNQVIEHRRDALNLEYLEGGIETSFGRVAPVWQCPHQLIQELQGAMDQMNPRLQFRVYRQEGNGAIVEVPPMGSAQLRLLRKRRLASGTRRPAPRAKTPF